MLSKAIYKHPAFYPHLFCKRLLGINGFIKINTIFSILCIAFLSLGAWIDDALILGEVGYGYLEHPGILGWYLIQIIMPIITIGTLKKAFRCKILWQAIISKRQFTDSFHEQVIAPIKGFIGFKTTASRVFFSILFTVGFINFAWNTYQNLYPGELAPLDFWDSKTYIWGYIGTRFHKFYMYALLLPSLVHIFGGILWVSLHYLYKLSLHNKVEISAFNPDRCGGLGFLADLILTPTIIGLLISGVSYYGMLYTHRTIDPATVLGSIVVVFVFSIFYILPTLMLRRSIKELKIKESDKIHIRQKELYDKAVSGQLDSIGIAEAKDYIEYFEDVRNKIDSIPNWPHFAKVFGTFSLAISIPLFSAVINFSAIMVKVFSSQS